MTESEIINKYVGIPYVHLGRNPKTGLDCLGLILSVLQDLGNSVQVYDYENYTEDWSKSSEHDLFVERMPDLMEKVNTPRPFDLVLFKNFRGLSSHSGIVLSKGRFLHTCKAGTVQGKLSDRKWANSLSGFYRIKSHD